MDAKTRWISLCKRLREAETAAGQASAIFGTLVPCTWRGKSTFQPMKAALLTQLVGSDWYERMYRGRHLFFLSHDQMKRWSTDPEILKEVQQNLLFYARSPQGRNLTVVGYSQLLQTALEFGLSDCFALLWDQAFRRRSWTPEESALLYLTQ